MRQRARVIYVATLLATLGVVQVRAQVVQVVSGFRPLSHPPTRVPYSWDMFAIRLDRCVVGFDPPLDIDGQRVARWHDREPAIEFDTVFNAAAWYETNIARACDFRKDAKTTASMLCFSSDGGVHERSFVCP
jgi:hypothetical protein